MILFRDTATAHAAISFAGPYLAVPNVGILGSHGAMAVPLLATLLAWGRSGIAARIERCRSLAEHLAEILGSDPRVRLLAAPKTGIVVWKPRDSEIFGRVAAQLPAGAASMIDIAGERWFRMVTANPNADIDLLIDSIQKAVR